MEKVRLGKSELLVSRVCLGTWQAHGWASSDDDQISACISSALDVGINFIDTAPAYGKGHSEKLIGKAISGKRDQVILATKVWHDQCSPEKLRASLEESLTNLQTDYIDLLQQHWPGTSPALDEVVEELARLKDEGKIRAVGVSNWDFEDFNSCLKIALIDSLQPCYSLLWRRIELDVLPLCRKHEISVLPYSPLCQGILSGKFGDLSQIPKDPRKQNVLTKKEIFPQVLSFLEKLREVSTQYQKSPSQVALKWLLQQEGITSVIVGCSKPAHVIELQELSDWELSKEDLLQLTERSDPFISLTAPFRSLWNWHPCKKK
ncbi:MAG: aldo/keto reductase [Bdellovibrionales bacterium]|nr:aldo/keto reductase [Bdellovibrionales bacterium]